MPRRAEFLTRAEGNLQQYGMRVSRDVDLPDGQSADLVGSRTYFSWKGLVILSQHIVVQDCHDDSPTPADAKALFDAGFRHAKRRNRVPLLRGMQFGYMVVPCLIVGSASPELIDYAERRPPRHWSLFEFPVVVDRVSGHTHYYRQTAAWGAFFFSDLRRLVERCVTPAMEIERGVGC